MRSFDGEAWRGQPDPSVRLNGPVAWAALPWDVQCGVPEVCLVIMTVKLIGTPPDDRSSSLIGPDIMRSACANGWLVGSRSSTLPGSVVPLQNGDGLGDMKVSDHGDRKRRGGLDSRAASHG
jgi:hypothetical protein